MPTATSFSRLLRGAALPLVCGLLPLLAAAQAPSRLQPTQLQPDVQLLREALVQLHPGLYRHLDSVNVDRRLAALSAGPFSQARTLPEAYRQLSQALADVRDAHTYLDPLTQSKTVQAQLLGRPTALPFRFRLIDRRMLITDVMPAAKELPVKGEVIAIDGHAVSEVLDSLLTATRGDGANDAARLRLLWGDGRDPAASFDVLYPLFFKVGSAFKVEYRAPDGSPNRTTTVPAVRATDREAALEARPAPATPLGWAVSFPDSRTARLTLADLATAKAPDFDWRKWLADAFGTIRKKNVDALILDLRACEGGDDAVVPVLLSYLTKKPVRLPVERQLWRTNRIPAELASLLDYSPPTLRQLQPAEFRAVGDGLYEKADQPEAPPTVRPAALAFQGASLYAMCGPRNAGAAFRVLRTLQENKLATLVGQPTGGNRRGTTAGPTVVLHLPNTGLAVTIPLVAYQPLRAQPDQGLEPDEVIEPTIDAFREGQDLGMTRVTQLLREARQD